MIRSLRVDSMMTSAPTYYQYSKIFEAIQAATADDLDLQYSSFESLRDQLYVVSATWGLRYWEQVLGILTIESDSYDVRRSRVLGKLRGVGNFSADLVHSIANAYTQDKVIVGFEPSTSEVVVEFIEDFPNTEDFKDQLEEIIHAHLQYRYISSMKAETKPKTNWKQTLDNLAINLSYHTSGWGYVDGVQRDIYLDGETRLSGAYLLDGTSKEIGPQHVIRDLLTMSFRTGFNTYYDSGYTYDGSYNYAGLHPYDYKYTYDGSLLYNGRRPDPIIHNHALQVSFPSKSGYTYEQETATAISVFVRSLNSRFLDGRESLDGELNLDNIFLENVIASAVGMDIQEPGIEPQHSIADRIEVQEQQELHVNQDVDTAINTDAVIGASSYNGRYSFDGTKTYGERFIDQPGTMEIYKNDQLEGEFAV